MDTKEHNAGPWHFEPRRFGKHAGEIVAANKKYIASVVEWPEHFANARLIAAAPEMLAVLKELVAKCDLSGQVFVVDLDKAREAIKHAEG